MQKEFKKRREKYTSIHYTTLIVKRREKPIKTVVQKLKKESNHF